MSDFKISEPTEPRFEGDFLLEPEVSHQKTPEERAYLDKLKTVLTDLARDEEYDDSDPERAKTAYILARKDCRKSAAAALRQEAEQFIGKRLSPEFALENALVIKGMYRRNLQLLSDQLFIVQEKYVNNRAVDVKIDVAQGLAPPNDKPSAEQEQLYVALSKATMVVRTVCQRMTNRADRLFNQVVIPVNTAPEKDRAALLLDANIRKLAGIGRLGLEGTHTALAKLALDGLREEFVAQEGGRIKNSYIRSLGTSAGIVAIAMLLVYVMIENGFIGSAWWQAHKNFLLAAAGGALGTWLSFSIRRVQLSFDDLAILEEDMLDPSVRVVFVVGLTLAACLLFWTGAINIEIGNLKTQRESFAVTGSIALLVGLFCGIAERALATAISGRAAAFVKGVGG